MTDFSKYNQKLTEEDKSKMTSTKNRIINAGKKNEYSYPEPVKGKYIAQVDKMALREENGRVVFRVTFKLLEGTEEETQAFMESWPGTGFPKIPYGRPLTNTKNDAVCIGSVLGMLNRMTESNSIDFDGDFTALAETVQAVFEAVKDRYAYEVQFNPEEFYRFSIINILEAAEEDSQEGESETEAAPEEKGRYNDLSEVPAEELKNVRVTDFSKPSSYPAQSPDTDTAPKLEEFSEEIMDDEDFPF